MKLSKQYKEKNKINLNGDREDILQYKNHGNTFKHPFSVLSTSNLYYNQKIKKYLMMRLKMTLKLKKCKSIYTKFSWNKI